MHHPTTTTAGSSSMSAAVKDGLGLVNALRRALEAGNDAEAGALLAKLKILLTGLPSLPPSAVDDRVKGVVEERTLARDVLEMAVFYSTRTGDRCDFPLFFYFVFS